jgi:hypothetical protein
MDVSKLNQGEKIAGIAGVALIIFMFLNWWGAPTVEIEGVGDIGGAASANAWEAADLLDILWFITGVAAIALAVVAATQTSVNMPVALSAIVAGLGILSLIFIVIRLIDPPFDADREYGAFLGLIAIAGIAYGGWMAMQEEGTSFGDQADRFGGDRGQGPPPPPPPPPAAPPSGPPPGGPGGPAA